jgi:hypothetical protein
MMTHKLLLASLLLPALAAAQPKTETCTPTGDVLFAIDSKDAKVTSSHEPLSSLKLYDNGAWTLHEIHPNGTTKRDDHGCLDTKALQTIKDDLKVMTWKIDTTKVHCMMIASGFTEYSSHGKVVFTSRVCGESLVDADTQKFDEIKKLINASTQPAGAK